MGKKIWSMSTTVRNPNRIKDFLIVIDKMNGKEWNKDTQIEYQIRLIQERFYVPTNENLSKSQIDILGNAVYNMTYEEAKEILESKQYVDPDMRGRTSYKPLEKWGLVFIIDNKITITETGRKLLNGEADLGDICFRSLLKWQYPNPIDSDFCAAEYDIKPFVAVLHLINEVNNLCIKNGLKSKGISKEEFGIFALSLINYKDIEKVAEKLIEFRSEYEKLDSRSGERKEYIQKWCDKYLKDFDNVSYSNIRDYTDNAIRYFRLTRYLYIRGGGYYIDIEQRRLTEVLSILSEDNASSKTMIANEYMVYLSDYSKPTLSFETQGTLINIARNIELEIKMSKLSKNILIEYKDSEILNTDELKKYIKYLRTKRIEINNLEIKEEYSKIENIDETISKLRGIFKSKEKASVALEKWINIALNIINDAKLIKPNYPVGDDNEPTFTAPSNVPDIECYYQNFSSICEVTMLTNRSQWYNEGQPVQRHLRDFENKQNVGDVYCLFVAPKMHRDTINTFWIANKYEYEGKKQKIVPLNIFQIIEILEYIKYLKINGKSFSNYMLKELYDNIIYSINEVQDSIEWLEKLDLNIEKWKNIR